jgi:perosamine synthetase
MVSKVERDLPHYRWPPPWPAIGEAVAAQLSESISIYDRSGVFERFESKFASLHDRRFGLLHNSGTSALLAMYFGAGLSVGDEVIAPVLTFPATVSPMLLFGARPVFADCDANGNLLASEIDRLVTSRTKAVVVTHLWGWPAEMAAICDACSRLGLMLLEDCSHAHGARYRGRLTGTFGTAAAWSLQGGKTVTGGEGGILLTDDQQIYERSLLLGHYNKRCKQELSADHPLHAYFTTGFGMKLRAHPLAIAIAEVLLDSLEEILEDRHRMATLMRAELSRSPHIRVQHSADVRSSFYALPFNVPGVLDADHLQRQFHGAGLYEADHPSSTRPLYSERLFDHPEVAFPWLNWNRTAPTPPNGAWNADDVYGTLFKLPVWSEVGDVELAVQYCSLIVDIVEEYFAGLKGVEGE